MRKEKHHITCILCPRGCQIELTARDDEYVVVGNRCKKGKEYALNEVINPTRTLTTTVKTKFKDFPRVPVRTDREVPLKDIFLFMKEINKVIVDKRLSPGDIVIKNIKGSDINLIATDDMKSLSNKNNGSSAIL